TGSHPLVMEVSSFQCETMQEFKPQTAVITNLAPDHLDRYGSIQEYYQIKFRIAKNQAPNEALWLGPRVEGDCPGWVPSRKRSFDMHTIGPDGLFYADGTVIHRDGSTEERVKQPSFETYPSQQVLNALAAAGAALSFGVPLDEALHALESFQPLPHRLEFVAEVNGMRCYNDSKATNVHALEAALRSLPGPIRLIAGGRPKGDRLDSLEPFIREKVRAVYLIGEAADEFAAAWRPLTEVHLESTLEAAVDHGLRDGRPGEILLLSPACASWDMFPNYKVRGDLFKQCVMEWRE
ncbi:MAG: UDP-N-acetylmuramoyl-L-alanine--D-glutamate ligase, partial [Candidatus Hinthialibacter sp.]